MLSLTQSRIVFNLRLGRQWSWRSQPRQSETCINVQYDVPHTIAREKRFCQLAHPLHMARARGSSSAGDES